MLRRHCLIHRASALAAGALVAVGAIALTGSASFAYAAHAGANAAPKCQGLAVSAIPVAKLEASYRTLTHLSAKTPLVAAQPRRYGVCGSTHYAFDLFTVAKGTKLSPVQLLAQENHSPVWSESANGRWVDGKLMSLCDLAPAALINLWQVGVTCK